jgi:O-antigen/teichoic acid export membrane protein
VILVKIIDELKSRVMEYFNSDNEIISFIAHSKNYLKANVLIKAIGLITMPIFTYLLLPSSYGTLSIFQAAVGIFTALMALGMTGGIYRRYFEKKKDFPTFLGGNITFITMFSILFIAFVILFSSEISALFGTEPIIVILASIASFITILFSIYTRLLQAKKMSKKYSNLFIIQSLAIVIISITLMLFLPIGQRYFGSIFSTITVFAILSVYGIIALAKESKFKLKRKHIKYSLLFGIPLIPHSLGGYLLSYLDRIIIVQITTISNAGIYTVGYNIGMVLLVAITAVMTAWSPSFFSLMKEKNYEKIQDLAKKATKMILFFAIPIIFFSEEFILLALEKSYHESTIIVAPVVIGYIFFFFYSIYMLYSEYEKKTILISINTITSVIVNIGLNYWLIPIYGYVAAAYTTMASYFLLFAMHYITTKYVVKANAVRFKKIIPSTVLFFGFVGIYFILEALIPTLFTRTIIKIALLLIFAYLLFKKT